MFTFAISHNQAIDMLVEDLCLWHWDPDMSAHSPNKPLGVMDFDALEQELHHHVRLEEEMNGFEPGLLSNVKFKIVRDYELAGFQKPEFDASQVPPHFRAEPAMLSQPISAKRKA